MIYECPMCFGKPLCQPLARTYDGPCDYCGGDGLVDTESVCKCGRPGIRLVEGVMVCTRFTCITAILDKKKGVVKT